MKVKQQPAQAYRTKAELIRDYGNHELAFFGLNAENRHFLVSSPSDGVAAGAGLVNYRVVGNVAVVLGDPVCAPEACEQVTRSFLDFCAQRHWRAAFYQAKPDHLNTYSTLNLRAFKMGEEAILYPQTFTLSGSAMGNVRTSCRRAEREGVRIHWYEGVPPPEVMQQLEGVSSAWLEHKAGERTSEMGFSTGRLDELIHSAELADTIASISMPANDLHADVPRLVTAVATTSSGEARAFVTFTPIYGLPTGEAKGTGWGWALDLMRRAPDAPPGVMELLLVRAIERFRLCEALVMSLGLVAWADTRQERSHNQRQFAGFVTDRLLESRRTLFNFKEKFHPCWESRYLVTSSTFALPRIALAILRLRNYSGGRLERLIKFAATSFDWKSTCWQFMRYCLVGGANTLIDLLVLNVLLWRLPTNNVLHLAFYNSIAYTGGAVSSFFLNKYWTFQRAQRPTAREVIRFAISLCLEVLYSSGLVWLTGKVLQPMIANPTLWANASKLVAVAAGAVISYIFMRFWTFAGGSQKQARKQEAVHQTTTRSAPTRGPGVIEGTDNVIENERGHRQEQADNEF